MKIDLTYLKARLHGSRRLYVLFCRFFVNIPPLRAVYRPPAGYLHLFVDTSLARSAGVDLPDIALGDYSEDSEQILVAPASFAVGKEVANMLKPAVYMANQRSVVTLYNGQYRNASGYYEAVVLDKCNRLLVELSPDANHPGLHRIYEDLSLHRPLTIPGQACVLTTPGARNNYFHWLIELIPKIALLKSNGFLDSRGSHFIVNHSGFRYQYETLALFGIEPSSVIQSFPGLRLHADRLVVPTHASHYEAIPMWSLDFLQMSLVGRLISEASPKKIFIYRPSATRRRLINNEEVRHLLGRRGFIAIDPGRLSFLEQAILFANADHIVAEHGAALASLAFSRMGAQLLEIFSPFWSADCYRVIASQRKISYGCVSGVACSPRSVPDRLKISAPFRLPIERLIAAIDLMEQSDVF